MLLGTDTVKSGGSVGKLQCNQQPLFRGESQGLVNLPLSQHSAKLAGTPRSIQTGKRGCGFHSAILQGNAMPVTTQNDDFVETPPPSREYICRSTCFQATVLASTEQDRAPR